jgi:cyclic-di-AMP phosphodiesterase PgpH
MKVNPVAIRAIGDNHKMPDSGDKLKFLEKNKKTDVKKSTSDDMRKKLEKILPDWVFALNEPKWQRWLLIIGASLVAAFLITPKAFKVYDLNVGVPAQETIISPITFKVFDEEATSKSLDEVLKSVRPIYDLDDEMVHEVQSRITSAFNYMTDYLAQEADFKAKEEDKSKDQGMASDQQVQVKTFKTLDNETLRTRFENILGANISLAGFEELKRLGFNSRIQRDLKSMVVPVLAKGVVQSRDLLLRDGKQGILLKFKTKDKLESLKDLTAIYDLAEAVHFIDTEENDTTSEPALEKIMRKLARDLINVNINYNREKSAALKQEALAQVKSVYFQVAKGEPIIKEGEPVNEGHIKKLEGLNKANPTYGRYVILAGFCLLLILLLRLTMYFSEKHLDRSKYATDDLMLICLLLIGIIICVRFMNIAGAVITASGKSTISANALLYAAPVATGSMLVALMVDARIAFLFSVLAAITASLSVEGDIYLFTFYFVSSIVGLHGMTRILDRKSVLRAGLVVGLVNMLSIAAIKMALGQLTSLHEFYEVGFGFIGGVLSGLLASGLSPLLEPLGYTTNIKLMELANLNHPLLKEMAQEAPATYHHSILVGNLAESAAELIGANPLLARVGAMYHDIGKVGKKSKPTYFIENQGRAANPHDKLEPSMSALVLVSHVKYGVEKAKEYHLGQPIIDIIEQHHGSSLIKFFYVKALEKAERTRQPVSEDKYRYPGPRPQTKEAALVMLADVAEAACRTLAEPTPARIQKRVQTLVLSLFSEGQLDQSTLTLKDLHAITKSFVRALQGMLHTRIEYPKDSESQEKAHGDSHRQPPDKDRSRPGRSADENGTNIRRLGL